MAIALACVALLAGCSGPPVNVAVETQTGTPDGFDSSSNLLNGEPGAIWIRGRDGFAVVTYGSSSCPPIPTALEVVDENAMTVTFVRSANNPCSADLGATTSRFDTPEGIAESGAVELTVFFDFEQDYEYSLTLD